ncbi:hypothetical protein F5Y16DRAFT_225394 [Xylariaceae sp. FL0255]|nr:hypothetical protein F5Y16DRAFT_225394 [Xylariaceae sp. FL0255]
MSRRSRNATETWVGSQERGAKRIRLDTSQATAQPTDERFIATLSHADRHTLLRAAEILGLGPSITGLPQVIPRALNRLPDGSPQSGTPLFNTHLPAHRLPDLSSRIEFDPSFPLDLAGIGVSDNCFRLFEPLSDVSAFNFGSDGPQTEPGADDLSWNYSADIFASSHNSSNGMPFWLNHDAQSANPNLPSGHDRLIEPHLANFGLARSAACEAALNGAALSVDNTVAPPNTQPVVSDPFGNYHLAPGIPASLGNLPRDSHSPPLSPNPDDASGTLRDSSATERGSSSSMSGIERSNSHAIFKSPKPQTPELAPQSWPRKPKKRAPFQDRAEREQTRLTRKLGACIRCRIQKERCVKDEADPDGPCMTCRRATATALTRPICVRKKVTDAKLYAKGEHPQFRWSKRWKSMKIVNIKTWASSEVRTIWVTQDVAGLEYSLRVRQFVPIPGDSLRRSWSTRGVEKHYECSNYAIENMLEAGENLKKFVDNSIEPSIDFYIDKSDWLLHQTYKMALKHSEESKNEDEKTLVRTILRLWVSIRMESRSERICGSETLGMRPQDYDPECRNYGEILIPPVMSAQIELIATSTVLIPMRKQGLTCLRELIEKRRTTSWFANYLCIFILLHSCALLTDFEKKQAKKYGLRSRYVEDEFVKELHHGSFILLSYFHYCLKGSCPLLMDSSSLDMSLAGLTPRQVEFIDISRKEIKNKEAHFRKIRGAGTFEDPYFFLCQLFDRDWSPDGFA